MRFTHIDVNFDVTYDGHQKPSKCPQKVFRPILMTDVKFFINICDLIMSILVQMFDFLTFEIFLTT